MLNKKEIEFLENLEARLNAQAEAKTKNVKDKLLISGREFQKFWSILDKIEREYVASRKHNREKMNERRKLDKNYGRPYYRKQYSIDKEKAIKEGKKFTRTIQWYKENYNKKYNVKEE